MQRILTASAALLAGALTLTACGSGAGAAGGATTVTYWLWDANQQPAYQRCADDFEQKNPGIHIRFEQRGWDDYWPGITFGLVSESAPDVFTDHLAKFGDLARLHQLLPLDTYVERDKVSLDQYAPGLADLWVSPEGERYGLPKDWDTLALFYNTDMIKKAGLTSADLNHLTWNPEDGGSYEKAIARLTVDRNGKRGDEPGFDRKHVRVYGMWMDASSTVGGGRGQTQWSMYANTTGWQYMNQNPWGTRYHYDDPRFQQTIAWYKSLIDKGYMPSFEVTKGVQWSDQLAAGRTATATGGSWMISTAYGYKGLRVGIAPTPVGPDGRRASMFNGLADSIYKGTRHPEEAWKWVKYLASSDCQNVVAAHTVVFPAINTAWRATQKNYAAKGIDVSAFTDHVRDKTTFLYPISGHAADIDAVMEPAMESVLTGQSPVSSLTRANQQVNDLFRK
ncbi:ABC transporter substrate-binding protein [Streptomyces sp.]|uniref:ABC transporter substrate-binding protein n=1 Tax=Streptomyces sp. TaxID=1931 RepID=UPI002F428ADD